MIARITSISGYKRIFKKIYNSITIASLLLFLLNSHFTSAQQMPNGTSAIEAGGGVTYKGGSFYGAYVRYFKDKSNVIGYGHLPCPGDKALIKFFPNRMYGKASLYYESGSGSNVNYTSTGLDLAFYYTLLKIGKSVFINLKGGAGLSSDKMEGNGENNNGQSDRNYFNCGLLAGAEVEWFLSPKFTLVGGGDQRFFFNNQIPLSNPRGFAYAGIRLNFVKTVERIL